MKNLILILLIFFLFSCSIAYFNIQNTKKIKSIEKIFIMNLDFAPTKALYSSRQKYLYLSNSDNLFIYQNKKLINKLGGLGFESRNFSSLDDFCLSNSDLIYVLDGLQKKVSILDKRGGKLNSVNIQDFIYPKLISITSNNDFFIYDKDANEIKHLTDLSEKPDFTFAKFDFDNAKNLSYLNGKIVVTTSEQKTFVYDITGQLINRYSDYRLPIGRDMISKTKYALLLNEKTTFTSLKPISQININEDYLSLITKSSVAIFHINYE